MVKRVSRSKLRTFIDGFASTFDLSGSLMLERPLIDIREFPNRYWSQKYTFLLLEHMAGRSDLLRDTSAARERLTKTLIEALAAVDDDFMFKVGKVIIIKE